MSTRLQYSFGSIALFLGAFFFFPSLVSAATPVAGGLGPDAHWTLEGSPYIVQFHNIFSGAGNAIGDTLTIDPGVVVKFEPGSQFLPGGTMIARGTSDQPIIFTSLFDDAADGQDSDGLGPTTGTVGDWYRISGGDPTIDFDHVQMRYSTLGLQLYFSTQPVSITNSLFRDNSYGIMLAYGSDQILVENSTFRNNGRGFELLAMTNTANFIRNNNIYDNQVYGAENLTPDRIVDMRGNFWGHATGPFHPTNNPSGQGDQVNDGILFDPWLESETGKSRIDPVIIIPGILGSSQKNGVFVIDPIMHVYDNLLDTLEANGYQRGVSLFTFPYNWRNSNVDTALLLRDKIDLVQEICQCDKVDVVAHSMGGLVARQYVQSENYEEDIDQMMFLGTPHFGAPKSYLAWEGSHVGFGLPDKFLALSLTREGRKLGYDSLFDYMRNRPISSLQETLPIYDYLKDDDTGDLRPYPDNYPQNSFLENLDDSFGSLLSSGIELFNIIGNTGEATISTIRVVDSPGLPLWEHGYPEGLNEKIGDRGLELGEGDGTVPQISSVISDQTLQISTDHIELVTQAEGIVYKTLTGNDPIVLINDPLKVPNVLLAISMLSPADFQVIAPDGKKIGKDFLTGAEINEIEGAFYSGFVTDDEYVTIPDPLDGEYRV
ncbi:MAG: right-handed parallel beta-helix repeat-containing protein, partial [bacterium]|nr:right-handed parallel beta-helix repeat-containing protein [bacterium]